MKNFGEKGEWAYPGTAQKFSGTPYYLRNGKSYRFQIWPVHSEGPSKQKPIKNFGEKGAWVYPGTAQNFRVPPIMGALKMLDVKMTDVKLTDQCAGHEIAGHENDGPNDST